MDTVEMKVNRCRSAIIKWNKEKHLNSRKLIEDLRNNLEEAMVSPLANQAVIAGINNELQLAYTEEESFWKQRSRQLWLALITPGLPLPVAKSILLSLSSFITNRDVTALGDKNTEYFHAAAKGRQAINKFSVIVDETNNAVHEEEKIVGVITKFYQELFTSQGGESQEAIREALEPCITEEINEKLIATPTWEEVRAACFSIHPGKAPGPDGFSACFFQSNWSTVKEKVTTEIQAFFTSGTLPPNINTTHVRLIPKITSPKKVADYRPIALCNVYFKIISKILTLRLQPVLNEIVTENQSACSAESHFR
ncbi:unnamed protein product [Microthlaspi erraticum]|uniref:Reverse transcriptase domain-containing protein n=1 Tax=Microthlaspi erraticum TaxID=1685480 RepID=A0A6D2KST3_9BRAS|nr:unnamed protein product [Microthlaspi erraticum]